MHIFRQKRSSRYVTHRHNFEIQSVLVSKQGMLLYSWRFSRYRASFHWLVHGHMTSNNETVSRQIPWAGIIAKTMMSNGKQFIATCEMLTAVAHDRWNPSAVFKFCFCFGLLYNKSLNYWSLGKQWILFPSNLNVSLDIEILGKQNQDLRLLAAFLRKQQVTGAWKIGCTKTGCMFSDECKR